MKASTCLAASVVLLFPRAAIADDRYEELKAEAWRPLAELRMESMSAESAYAIHDADLDLGSEHLSLEALLREVQRRNPSLESALNTWRAALAEYPQAKALDDPMLSYSVAPLTLDRPRFGSGRSTRQIRFAPGAFPSPSFSRTDSSGRGFSIGAGPPPSLTLSRGDGADRIDQGHVIELSQAFPWPGKRRLRGEVALLDARGARADIETVRQELVRETKAAYYEYWYVDRALEINAINHGLLEEFQNIAESKYASGTVSKQDALQAEVEREHLGHQAIVLNRLRTVTRARINLLLNRPPDTQLPPPPNDIQPPGHQADLDSLIDIALSNRSELRAMGHRSDAKAAGVALARKDFRPDFKAMAQYNSMWANEDHRFMVGVGLNIPIQLGKRRGAVDKARAEQARLEADIARQAAEVAFQVKEAHEMLHENKHVVELYEGRLIPAAEENFDAAESGYASAEVDFLALISAQRLLMDTHLNRYEALANYHQAAADLERAVGRSPHDGGLAPEVDAPEVDAPEVNAP